MIIILLKKVLKTQLAEILAILVKSNHLFEPFTSTPKNGISNKDTKKIINNNIAIL